MEFHCPSDLARTTGSQLLPMNKNRCLSVAGVELYLGQLLHSTMLKVAWDQAELMLISMDELLTKYDYPFTEGVTYRSLKPATLKFQNMVEGGKSPICRDITLFKYVYLKQHSSTFRHWD